MVTIADDFSDLYPVDTSHAIVYKGFINGNYGNYNRHWLLAADGDEVPGRGVQLHTGADGERTADLWGANDEEGYGVVGWDRSQISTQSSTYDTGDAIPVYPFAENPGMIFQGYVADTDGAWNAGNQLDAAASGGFADADLANRVYSYNLYYVADTAAAAQLIVMQQYSGAGG